MVPTIKHGGGEKVVVWGTLVKSGVESLAQGMPHNCL